MTNELTGQALIVLGSPRSGTSAVTKALQTLGAFVGLDRDFYRADENNRAGYFELTDVIALNKRCMDALFIAHDRPTTKANLSDHPAAQRLALDIKKTLTKRFAGRDLWGWKEPQTTLLLPLYRQALNKDVEPVYIVCVRHPAAVAASQDKFTQIAPSYHAAPLGVRGYGMWLAYTLASLKNTIGAKRMLTTYEGFLLNPESTLKTAITLAPSLNAAAIEAAKDSVQPNLRHYSGEAEPLPDLVQRVWDLCQQIEQDNLGLQTGKYDEQIQALSNEHDLFTQMFGETDPPYGHLILQAPGTKRVGLRYLPGHTWQTLEIEVEAAPKTSLTATLYPLPAHVYVRDAVWLTQERETPATIRALAAVRAEESGSTRYSVDFNPSQVELLTPDQPGPFRLRLQVFVVMNVFTAFERLSAATERVIGLERQVAMLTSHSEDLETRLRKLQEKYA